MVVLTCYNKACSVQGKFEESENGPEACRFHPGGPVFHDAYKVLLLYRLWAKLERVYINLNYLYKFNFINC